MEGQRPRIAARAGLSQVQAIPRGSGGPALRLSAICRSRENPLATAKRSQMSRSQGCHLPPFGDRRPGRRLDHGPCRLAHLEGGVSNPHSNARNLVGRTWSFGRLANPLTESAYHALAEQCAYNVLTFASSGVMNYLSRFDLESPRCPSSAK